MLDKASRTFLSYLVKNKSNMDDGLFTFDFVGEELGMSKSEVFSCLKFLENLDLVECTYVEPPGMSKKMLWGFKASHKGRHHAEFSRMEFFKKVLESVLLPILVSIITAVLVSIR